MSDLPDRLRAALPPDTAVAWLTLAPQLPRALYLGGGTAIAAHLGHRESRDLDFFFHEVLDLGEIRDLIAALGAFAVTHESAGTLKGVFEKTKIEVLDASSLNLLGEPAVIAGLRVAGLHDLMAMKLKVMAERGEMRDYFDVKAIDEHGAVSVEEGVGLYMRRYGVAPSDEVLLHLYRAMGDLSDVEADDLVPADLETLRRWWSARQARILRNSDRFG